MILKLQKVLSICLIFLVSACDSRINDDQAEIEKLRQESKIYLSITRAQSADTETINEDVNNNEDRVHDLALLVFDSSTGEKICEYFDEGITSDEKEKSFTISLTSGERDFYFVANMPTVEIKNISTRTEMEAYMKVFRNLDPDLYLGAKLDKGFPMSRVYLKQRLTGGGNILQPLPFHPNGENRVKLIRCVAKLEIVIDGSSISGVKDIYLKNAFKQSSLFEKLDYPSTAGLQEAISMVQNGNSYVLYMPEAIMTSPSWLNTNHKPINYFIIEMLNGTFYEIPIITDDRLITDADYMTFATGKKLNEQPDYNIYRNRHYYYRIKKSQSLEIIYTIDPWIINRNENFMGYGYNVNVSQNGKITISNTVQVCAPHSILLKTIPPFTFQDGTDEKTFLSLDSNASTEYTLKPVPKVGDGDYLKIYYNVVDPSDPDVKTFSK